VTQLEGGGLAPSNPQTEAQISRKPGCATMDGPSLRRGCRPLSPVGRWPASAWRPRPFSCATCVVYDGINSLRLRARATKASNASSSKRVSRRSRFLEAGRWNHLDRPDLLPRLRPAGQLLMHRQGEGDMYAQGTSSSASASSRHADTGSSPRRYLHPCSDPGELVDGRAPHARLRLAPRGEAGTEFRAVSGRFGATSVYPRQQ
jgi:hypothetical protein